MRTVIAGGSGFLGTALTAALRSAGHEVVILTRAPRAAHHVRWDPVDPDAPWAETVRTADVVVNLAGESMTAGRWTPKRKTSLRQSRIIPTHALASVVAAATRPPLFLSGSAVGVYGTDGRDLFNESSPPGGDFLAQLCVDWEAAALAAGAATRVVLLRTGVVLGRNGGALPQLVRPFRFFVGGPIGSGHQPVSWIHLDDWVGLVLFAIGNAGVIGPFNLTAPTPVRNAALAEAIGRALHRPSVIPAPAFLVRLALGEMADAAILRGQLVQPVKALAFEYLFAYPTVDEALSQLLG